MKAEEFNHVIGEQIERSSSLLFSKNDAYNEAEDKLQNFKSAAALRRVTPQSALAGMMLKHTVSVFDMCEGENTYSMDVWNEKITDHINYLLLLRAIVEEQDPQRIRRVQSEEALAVLREKLSGTPNEEATDYPTTFKSDGL